MPFVLLLKNALQQKRILREETDDGTGGTGSGAGGGEGAGAGEGGAGSAGGGEGGVQKKPVPPSDEEAKLLKEIMKKKEEIAKLQKSAADSASILEKLNALGGLESLESLVTAQKEAEKKKLEEAGEWDRLKAQMAEQHDKTVKELKKVIEDQTAKQSALIGQLDELTIGASFNQSQFIKNTILTSSKARTVYGAHFDLVDGEVVGYDKPRGVAGRTPIVDAYGNNVSFDEALKKIVEADPEKDSIIKSQLGAGAGSGSAKPNKKKETEEVADGSISKISAGLRADKSFRGVFNV